MYSTAVPGVLEVSHGLLNIPRPRGYYCSMPLVFWSLSANLVLQFSISIIRHNIILMPDPPGSHSTTWRFMTNSRIGTYCFALAQPFFASICLSLLGVRSMWVECWHHSKSWMGSVGTGFFWTSASERSQAGDCALIWAVSVQWRRISSILNRGSIISPAAMKALATVMLFDGFEKMAPVNMWTRMNTIELLRWGSHGRQPPRAYKINLFVGS